MSETRTTQLREAVAVPGAQRSRTWAPRITGQRITTQHHAWADVSRVIAIFGVILIHACGASFYQFGTLQTASWLQSVALDSLVRCAVPLFVMLSGALILNPSTSQMDPVEEMKRIPKRLSRILLPLAVWSAIYLWYLSRSGASVDIRSTLVQPAMYHLWFVYMISGIYLIIPIISPVYETLRRSVSLSIYFFAAWFVVTAVPVYVPVPLLTLLQQNSLFGYGGYFIVGALLASRSRVRFSSMFWAFIFVIGVCTTAAVTWAQSARAGVPVETAFLYFSPNVVMASVAAFVLLSRIRMVGRRTPFFRRLSDASFIVYFVHILVLEYVRFNPQLIQLTSNWPLTFSILMIACLTFFLSMCIALLLRAVPGSKHVFG